MLRKNPVIPQQNLFGDRLIDMLDVKHELVLLSHAIEWSVFENAFGRYYTEGKGSPAKSIRLMVGLLILKHLRNLSDEVVVSTWVENPYYQYFCGKEKFYVKPPCNPTSLVKFRNRIGEAGVELIFKESIRCNEDDLDGNDLVIDTTAQEKNVTYPTDAKLAKKIIDKCVSIAASENIKLRRSYSRTAKHLMYTIQLGRHPKKRKLAKKFMRSLKTIAGRLIRELFRNMNQELLDKYEQKLQLFLTVLNQERYDKDKIYSLHEPEVACIAKGKAHRPYEFGSKVGLAVLPGKGLIVGIVNFKGNPHDSKTYQPVIDRRTENTGRKYKYHIVDKGYQGAKAPEGTSLIISGRTRSRSAAGKRLIRSKNRKRSGIEPMIGHMKYDFRMLRNYLKGTLGDSVNALLAGAAYNFNTLMKKLKEHVKRYFLSFFYTLFASFWALIDIFYHKNQQFSVIRNPG